MKVKETSTIQISQDKRKFRRVNKQIDILVCGLSILFAKVEKVFLHKTLFVKLFMKKYFIFSLFFVISFTSFSQIGTVKGVIMYFFNDNFGDKPDIGSKVYLVKNNSAFFHELNTCIKDDYYQTIDNYKQLISDFEHTNEEMKDLIRIPKDLRNKRKTLKSAIQFNEEKLYNYDIEQEYCIKQKLYRSSNDISGSDIVDGNGTFYFSDLDFGTYSIYIISKQRDNMLARIDINLEKKYQTISYTFKPKITIIKKQMNVDDTY